MTTTPAQRPAQSLRDSRRCGVGRARGADPGDAGGGAQPANRDRPRAGRPARHLARRRRAGLRRAARPGLHHRDRQRQLSSHRSTLGEQVIDGGTVTVSLPSPLPDGTYTVAYRVVSADGHPVQGAYQFTVTGATADAARSRRRTPGEPAAAQRRRGRWWHGRVVVAVAGAGRARRRRSLPVVAPPAPSGMTRPARPVR